MNTQQPTHNEMYDALLRRDAAYDGVFVVGVRSTGIFCRPTCPARKPRPENVTFFHKPSDAVLAGFRACKRCRPEVNSEQPPDWLAPLFAHLAREPLRRLPDAELAQMGMDPIRVRRYFQRHHGTTFQGYHRAQRLGQALRQLHEGENELHVAFDHGYESSSGFRDAFARLFGTTPGRSRGAVSIHLQTIGTPVGPMVAGACDRGVCLLEFMDRPRLKKQMATLRRRLSAAFVPGTHPYLGQLESELGEYFAGRRRAFTVPLCNPGTPFQESVWEHLLTIPFGTTWSYDRLAREVGRPTAWRAVGSANGANRVAILVPCHRVIQKSGELRGYGGGLWRKRFLLALEADAPSPLTSDKNNGASASTHRAHRPDAFPLAVG